MALSSCVLGWDVDQWPGPQQAYTGHQTGWHDVRLVPDLATLRPAAWLDRTAICVADFVEMGRDDLVAVAPRTILRRQIQHVEDAGFTPQVATELEFALYRGTYDEGRDERLRDAAADHARARRLHRAGRRSARGVLRRRPRGVVGVRARTVDQPGGVGPRPVGDQPGVSARVGDGRPSHPVQARDRDMAAAAGMSATFMPKPFGDTTGSSCHLHLSLLNASGVNVFHDAGAEHGVAPTLSQAVGGLLQRAPDLMLFYAPTINSYRRTTSGEFSGNGAQLGIRQPHGLVPRARGGPGVHAAGVARARRRREPVPRDRRRCSRPPPTGSGPARIPASR